MDTYGNDCPNTDNGAHMVDWVDVPAQRMNGRLVYGDHQRGECIACDQMFRRNP